MERSGNPAFKHSIIANISTASNKVMTVSGTYAKTLVLLLIVIMSAAASWQWMKESIVASDIRWLPLWIASIVTLFLAMVISFNPKSASKLAIPYAILQGGMLGIVSGTFANSFEGIVGQAVFTTFAVFLAVYVGYALGFLRATSAFTKVIVTAILGILMFSFLSWIFSLFSISTPVIYSYGTWGIVFSGVVVLVAALSLVLDFDFIDKAADGEYPKYFEWYGAFGLMVGLMWLYMEIVRLLAKLAAQNR